MQVARMTPSVPRTQARDRDARKPGRHARCARATTPADLYAPLERALALRAPLLACADTSAFRVLNGAADGVPGLVLEKFDAVLVAQLHEGQLRLSTAQARELCACAQQRLGARAVYRKIFARERSSALGRLEKLHTDPQPWLGQPVEPELPVLESGARFLVRPYDGYSVGLFLEQRENRRRVRALAAGRCVLNAFAYTCGFSVAAALGGATATVSVDLSGKCLDWGRRNFAANGIEPAAHSFIRSDIFDYYRRAHRCGRRFDLIILDPPTFARSRRPRRVFTVAADLERLIAGAVELLNPGGYLLLATNHRGTSRQRLERLAAQAAGRRPLQVAERPGLPLDFRGDADYAKTVLVRVG